MKIICTGDWHLGNLFHGNDRLPEHRHFLSWLLTQITEQQPDALLVAGDVFDNGNPSAAAQALYYQFLVDAHAAAPAMLTVITGGNHDSASRLEAPRSILGSLNIEVRGQVHRTWSDEGWDIDFDDLIIPLDDAAGNQAAILAMPFLRNDILGTSDYSAGIRDFTGRLIARARELYPGRKLIMMAHLYASGAEIADSDASEKIIVGGQEQVAMTGWADYPDYFTCGHIHKRQAIRGLKRARYTGSVLPMSFAEKDYKHGVDLVTISNHDIEVSHLDYTPQHRLLVLPDDDTGLTTGKLIKLIGKELPDRVGKLPDENSIYLALKVRLDKIKNDDLRQIEEALATKNAVLCKIQRISPDLAVSTFDGQRTISSIDDILDRDPLETLAEAFVIRHDAEMSEHQADMLRSIIEDIKKNQ